MAAYSLLVFTLFAVASARPLDESLYLWNEWKATYNRQFSAYEEASRFSCFQTNLDIIDSLNAREGREIHGVNKFSALCPAEFKASHHNLKFNNRTSTNVAPLFSDEQVKKVLASDVDWRTKGAVTHVKDQGQCGSCWSFSATGNMEGQWFLSKNQLVGLSEEELVACSHNGNQGCNGGLMDYAFEWVTSNGGIDSEADYPYTSGTGRTGVCNTQKEKTFVAKFSSHQDVAKNEAQIATFLDSNGPVAIGVDAQSGWQTYRGGIMATCFGKQLDHGVLLVGYQGTGAEPYWIVKNSWGTSWGESGYIRLKYGSDQCGITQAASSAKV